MPCSVCRHPQADQIATAFGNDTPAREVAVAFGLHDRTVQRHFKYCLKPAVAKALARQELATGARLIARVEEKQAIVSRGLSLAVESGELKHIAPLTTSFYRGVELTAKLAGVEGFRPASSTTLQVAAGQGGQVFIALPQAAEPLAIKGADVIDVPALDLD